MSYELVQIPEEEKNIGLNDRLIHVYHFMKDINQAQVVRLFELYVKTSFQNYEYDISTKNWPYFALQQIQNFGDPFFLLVREGETLAEVKKRIQIKLQVSAEEFSKVIHF